MTKQPVAIPFGRVTRPIQLLLCVSVSLCLNSLSLAATPIRFAVIGDRTGGHTPGVYDSIVVEIERLKPDFTMTVGDMIEGYTADTVEIRRQWDEYKQIVSPLTAPIHWVPGNHDIWGEPGDPSISFYHRYVGEPYRSFDYNECHYIILDNSRWEESDKIPKEQIDWLLSDLKKHKKARQTMVFFHKPFWFETLAKGKSDRLHEIFKANGVDAVFTGHFHVYFCGRYDGIEYTSVGSSGGASTPGVTGLHYHFAWVTVDDNGIHVALVKKGSVLPWEEVWAEELVAVDQIRSTAVVFPAEVNANSDLTVSLQPLAVTFTNPHKNISFERTAHWELPDGWKIDPDSVQVSLAPGAEKTVTFVATASKIYSPVPVLNMRFPYAKEKDFDLEAQLPVMRTVECASIKKAPVIDGTLEESWANPVTRYFAPMGGLSQTDETEIYFARDDANLYIAARCRESGTLPESATTTRDGPVYGEECVGFFFAPAGVADGSVYQLYINPNSAIFDQEIVIKEGLPVEQRRDWNGEFEVKSGRISGGWTVEAKIPFSVINAGPVKTEDEWRVNFRRKQKSRNTSADWVVPITYEPSKFGRMVLK